MEQKIRIACAVPSVTVGGVRKSVCNICDLIDRAYQQKCRVVVFPELAVTGYTCADLFFQKLLRREAHRAIKTIADHTIDLRSLTCVIGVPLELTGKLYNCAVIIREGRLLGIVPKKHLTDHRESPEARWFAPSGELCADCIDADCFGLDAYSVPIGAEQVLCVDGLMLGVEICEDLFVKDSPSAAMAKRGVQLVVNPAASVQLAGKRKLRRELVMNQSASCGCAYAFCSAGVGESTRDSIYSGHSIIAQNGAVIAENKALADEDYLLIADIQPQTSFQQVNLMPVSAEPITRHPFAMDEESCCEMFSIQSAGLARRLKQLGCNAVLGVSGGLDSTLALLVCVEAMRRLGRPATDVYAVTMPCFGTTDRTYQNALELMKLLGVSIKEIDIRPAVERHFADIGHDPQIHNTTYENAQARERTQILMDYAGVVNAIVVGTGDLSELALGWCTYNADHMSMYSVNASIPKTVIPPIIRRVSAMPQYSHARAVLEDIIATPISPELLPSDPDGKIAQKTEDLVGPYALHDFFLYYAIKEGFAPDYVYKIACEAFSGEFDSQTVKKWLKVFYRRFFTQQFKRNCMPEGVKVMEFSLSPRGDWFMPGDASASLWLEEIESI